jgi:hypothetical protein
MPADCFDVNEVDFPKHRAQSTENQTPNPPKNSPLKSLTTNENFSKPHKFPTKFSDNPYNKTYIIKIHRGVLKNVLSKQPSIH